MKTCLNEDVINSWDKGEFIVVLVQGEKGKRLTIAKKNNLDNITWDEIQKLKDECGFQDHDAYELYPAKNDIINEANRRHIHIMEGPHPNVWRGEQWERLISGRSLKESKAFKKNDS